MGCHASKQLQEMEYLQSHPHCAAKSLDDSIHLMIRRDQAKHDALQPQQYKPAHVM
eukprot:CAMPEP_0172439332 /NCGR_PEP_ID=MMETSP1065-20121228/359_1 /TAXON_ID=265537 /ORGANISM="Amphiprora paludosa, Strain CCMP125" /LENGTH=55 /DNA_ID=CAMNT_0013188003 /DNA_START=26 /DNA_END=190 /DNA_ORIENTATION=+